MQPLTLILVVAGAVVVQIAVTALVFARWYRRCDVSEALVRTGGQHTRVAISDGGLLVLPILHRVQRVGLTVIRFEVERRRERTADDRFVDLTVEVQLRVEPTQEGVFAALRTFGDRPVDHSSVSELTAARFAESVREVVGALAFEQVDRQRREVADRVIQVVAEEVRRNGLLVDSVVVSALRESAPG
jgi:flotillin